MDPRLSNEKKNVRGLEHQGLFLIDRNSGW